MEVTGKIKVINATQQISAAYQKREIVITTEEQFPQNILIEFMQDRCDLVNPFKIWDKVTVSIKLKGREWVNPQGDYKYFNSIEGWRIVKS